MIENWKSTEKKNKNRERRERNNLPKCNNQDTNTNNILYISFMLIFFQAWDLYIVALCT